MKNVQIIDGALNSVFEIYGVSDTIFSKLFPNGADISFAEDFAIQDPVWLGFYDNPVGKQSISGIHGTLHLSDKAKKACFFPTRHEADVM
jgi:hypothetical protein